PAEHSPYILSRHIKIDWTDADVGAYLKFHRSNSQQSFDAPSWHYFTIGMSLLGSMSLAYRSICWMPFSYRPSGNPFLISPLSSSIASYTFPCAIKSLCWFIRLIDSFVQPVLSISA